MIKIILYIIITIITNTAFSATYNALISNNKFTIQEITEEVSPPSVIEPNFSNISSLNSIYGVTELNAIFLPLSNPITLGFLANNYGGFQFELPTPRTITSYKIRAYPDVESLNTNINNWTLEGSNDNSSWEVVDTVSAPNWFNSEIREFEVSSPGSYQFYKIIWTGGTYPYGIGITGFEITGY